jgi:hypothetical protein
MRSALLVVFIEVARFLRHVGSLNRSKDSNAVPKVLESQRGHAYISCFESREITLGNGEKIQTGTVRALLRNISAYDDLVRQMDSTGREECEESLRAEVIKYETMLKTPLPLLQKVGLFNLFSPEEWINGKVPGRKYVGRCAIEAGY